MSTAPESSWHQAESCARRQRPKEGAAECREGAAQLLGRAAKTVEKLDRQARSRLLRAQ